jgi:hypothetical protein
MIDILREKVQGIVRAAGADYLGEQGRLVLFRSRETGAALAMSIDKVLDGGPVAVRAHIQESDARYRT